MAIRSSGAVLAGLVSPKPKRPLVYGACWARRPETTKLVPMTRLTTISPTSTSRRFLLLRTLILNSVTPPDLR